MSETLTFGDKVSRLLSARSARNQLGSYDLPRMLKKYCGLANVVWIVWVSIVMNW